MKIKTLICGALLTLTGCSSLKVNNIDLGAIYTSTTNLVKAYTTTPEDEREMGKNMSALLLGTRPLINSGHVNRYVNLVGKWLALHSSQPNLDWRFGVIDTGAVNAFAAPGGYVFVTKGMLQRLNSEAELAAILAHEIIHVNEQHHLEAMKGSSVRDALFTSLSTIASAADLDEKDREYQQWAESVSGAARNVYSKGLSRDDELSADSKGLALMARAGYDPYAFLSTLQMLDSLGKEDGWGSLLFKTHPKPADRIDNLISPLEKLDSLPYALVLNDRYQSVINF